MSTSSGPTCAAAASTAACALRIAPKASTSASVSTPSGSGLPLGVIDENHVLEVGQALAGLQQPLEVLALDHRDARGCVGDDELDLVGRVGLVDRERGRAERDGGHVDDVELRAIAEHDRERVAAAQPQPMQPAGEVANAPSPLRPGERLLVALRADRDAIAERGTRDLKRLHHRGRVRGAGESRAGVGAILTRRGG